MVFASVIVLLHACQSPDPLDTSQAPEPADAWLAAIGCKEEPSFFTELTVEPTAMPTVFRARWTSPEAGVGRVAWQGADFVRVSPEGAAGTTHEALTLGIPSQDPVDIRAVFTTDAGTFCSEGISQQAGALAAALPTVLVSGTTPSPLGFGLEATAFIDDGSSTVILFDAEGRYVWAMEVAGIVTRIRLGQDKKTLRIHTTDNTLAWPMLVTVLGLDGTLVERISVPFHTDFVDLPDGTMAGPATELRDVEGTDHAFMGDTLVELNPDGSQRLVWDAFDWIWPDPSIDGPTGIYPADPEAVDWTHANSITWDEDEDAYYLTLLRLNALVKIARSTGTMEWILSPKVPEDFPAVASLDLLDGPHSVQHLDNGEYLVLNHQDATQGECSDVVSFSLDPASSTVTQTRQITSQPCVYITYLGNAEQKADGRMTVAWSRAGRIDRLGIDGHATQILGWEMGAILGYLTTITGWEVMEY